MIEFELVNNETGEHIYIWGYSYDAAFEKRPHLNRDDWTLIGEEWPEWEI